MYKDLGLSFPPLGFSVRIPVVPKILLFDLKNLVLSVFLPVKEKVFKP
jgi:hypothetical protein